MSYNHRKLAYYDYPLYMRLFPWFKNSEFAKRPQTRDASEDFITLYSLLVSYRLVKPNTWYDGYNW